MSIALKRISNEFKQIQNNPPNNWRATSNSEFNWIVWMDADVKKIIIIQECSPFNGIPIKILVSFPENYPNAKPVIKLAQPELFFHSNIGCSGNICHKIVMSDKMDVSMR